MLEQRKRADFGSNYEFNCGIVELVPPMRYAGN